MPAAAFAQPGGDADADILADVAFQQRVQQLEQDSDHYSHDEIIVVYRTSADAGARLQAMELAGCADESETLADDLDGTGTLSASLVTLEDGVSAAEAVARIERDPAVAYAQPNYHYYLWEDLQAATISPLERVVVADPPVNDPYAKVSSYETDYNNQWWLYALDLGEAWKIQKVSEEAGKGKVAVAVLDTGINFDHEDLTNNIDRAHAYDVVASTKLTTNPSSEDFAHGSHVAGIIAAEANNEKGVAGVSYNAMIVPIQVFRQGMDYSGTTTYTEDSDLLHAYEYLMSDPDNDGTTIAQEANVRVVNMSLGGYGSSHDSGDKALQAAIAKANDEGILTVAAAGNGMNGVGVSTPSFPSDFEEVVSVIATDATATRTDFSDHNAYKDISAPGQDIWATWWNGVDDYENISGTSMATPMVAGVAALLFAYNPELTVAEAREILCKTADDKGDPGRDDYYGYGIVNPTEALRAAGAASLSMEKTTMVQTTTQQLNVRIGDQELREKIGAAGWSWRSTDPTIASVDANGVVTARAPGTVTITAVSKYDYSADLEINEAITASRTLTVNAIALDRDITSAPALTEVAVNVGWSVTTAATSYDVYRAVSDGTDEPDLAAFAKVATVESASNTWDYQYVDRNVEVDSRYWYRVVPVGTLDGKSVEGEWSEAVSTFCTDKTKLAELIRSVRASLDEAAISADGSDISSNEYWASEEDADYLESVLRTARNAYFNPVARQQNINSEAARLIRALRQFEESMQLGKRFEAPDKTALEAEIARADALLGQVVVSADGSDVKPDAYWATAAMVEAVEDALEAASRVNDDETSVRADVERVLEPLTAATDALDEGKALGTAKAGDGAALVEAADLAADRIADIKVSVDGKDIGMSDMWVTADVMKAATDAIEAARKTAAKEGAYQSEMDAARAAMDEAVAGVDAAKKRGMGVPAADKEALDEAIAAANEDLSSVKVSADGTDIAPSAKWVTAVTRDELKSAISTARKVSADDATTQEQVDAALAKLQAAQAKFDAAKAAGTKQAAKPEAPKAVDLFDDVSASDWFIEGGWLDYVTANGLMSGYAGSRKFGPNDLITRGQVATILYRYANPDSKATTEKASYERNRAGFTDNESNQYYTAAINWAKDQGIFKGDSATNFKTVRPNENITRQELATVLYRFANGAGKAANGAFYGAEDAGDVAAFAADGVDWCYTNGIMTGAGTTHKLNPGSTATRAEMAKMITVLVRDVLVA